MGSPDQQSDSVTAPHDGGSGAGRQRQALRHVESNHIHNPSAVRVVLTNTRTKLWKAQPILLSAFFDPVRDFILDPVLALSCAILPPLLRDKPTLDKLVSYLLHLALYVPINALYCRTPQAAPTGSNTDDDGRTKARNAILQRSSANMPKYKPPSDAKASFVNALSFAVSAVGDIVGVMTNPAKMKAWGDALYQLKTYLNTSGVGDELEEAMYKPLIQGRLLDNIKMLSDIQEKQDADRHIEAKLEGEAGTNIEIEVREGHRVMRFATAAYGVEMIKGAIDFEVDPEQLSSHKKAIATHTRLDVEDIRYIYSKDDDDKHILHHFAAVDRKSKSIVLALRGTLSISGAIIDVQGMTRNFCLGLAHHGMSEMAEHIWEASGEVINSLFKEEELKDYGLIITGHSLGAGCACLLNIMCHVNGLVGDRKVTCYGFAPPPTYAPCNPDATGDGYADPPALVKRALDNCISYIHDNDAVPFLSITSIRRLALLLDTVDNNTEHIWFYNRWLMFHEYKTTPQHIFDAVAEAAKCESKCVGGESILTTPSRTVIWMKKNVLSGKFEGCGCDPYLVAKNTVFVSSDMISDHLAEMYEDALDALLEDYEKKS